MEPFGEGKKERALTPWDANGQQIPGPVGNRDVGTIHRGCSPESFFGGDNGGGSKGWSAHFIHKETPKPRTR